MLKTCLCLFILSDLHLLFLTMPMSLEEQQQLMSRLQKAQAEGVAMEALQDTLSPGRPSGNSQTPPPPLVMPQLATRSCGKVTSLAMREDLHHSVSS